MKQINYLNDKFYKGNIGSYYLTNKIFIKFDKHIENIQKLYGDRKDETHFRITQ